MTDEEAARRAVCLDPADDTPRLVLADIIEEADRPLEAEFIRTQIELARRPKSYLRRDFWKAAKEAVEGKLSRLERGGNRDEMYAEIVKEAARLRDEEEKKTLDLERRQLELFHAVLTDTPVGEEWFGMSIKFWPEAKRQRREMREVRGVETGPKGVVYMWRGLGQCFRTDPVYIFSEENKADIGRLFSSTPITGVSLNMVSPERSEAYNAWMWVFPSNDPPAYVHRAFHLILPEFLIPFFDRRPREKILRYETYTKTVTALSGALVNWGRSLAGLPRLPDDYLRTAYAEC